MFLLRMYVYPQVILKDTLPYIWDIKMMIVVTASGELFLAVEIRINDGKNYYLMLSFPVLRFSSSIDSKI